MAFTSLLTWLFVLVSGLTTPGVGGGGPIPKPHTTLGWTTAVGGGGPIPKPHTTSGWTTAVGGGGPIPKK